MRTNVLKTRIPLILMGAMTIGALWPGASYAQESSLQDIYGDPIKIQALLDGSDERKFMIIDVRTSGEFADGHIPGAINIPYDQIFPSSELGTKDALLIVYCSSGRRSAIARRTLMDLGYENVVDFGPIAKWTMPLEK
jgi:phage shock protein E